MIVVACEKQRKCFGYLSFTIILAIEALITFTVDYQLKGVISIHTH